MKEAYDIACKADDPMTQFAILSQLGHEMNAQNLDEGVSLLCKARDLYTEHLAARQKPNALNPELARAHYRLLSYVGVAEFDRGDFGAAGSLLTESLAGLRDIRMRDDIVIASNFLAQLHMATGRFEECEKLLMTIALFGDDAEPNAWNASNLALLGKLYLEWGRGRKAAASLEAGWRYTQKMPALDPIVSNYYAELLMHLKNPARDLAAAEQRLLETIDQCRKTHVLRSEIVALSLLSAYSWSVRGLTRRPSAQRRRWNLSEKHGCT